MPLALGDRAQDAIDHTHSTTLAAIAAEQAGGIQRCLRMATEHAKNRVQFGRPIGSFQAVKHLCADMAVHSAIADEAAEAAEGDPLQFAPAVSAAKARCSQAYRFAAETMLQIFVATGFTWEPQRPPVLPPGQEQRGPVRRRGLPSRAPDRSSRLDRTRGGSGVIEADRAGRADVHRLGYGIGVGGPDVFSDYGGWLADGPSRNTAGAILGVASRPGAHVRIH